MKIVTICITVSIVLLPPVTWAGNLMPCEHIKEKLVKGLSYYGKKQTPEFLECVSSYRVCAVADGQVVSSTLIKHMSDKHESTTFVIVQSPKNDAFPVCLIGAYNGGSAAAWSFDAYKILQDKAVRFRGMHKAYARGDAIAPQSAAKMTYEMFDKYAEKLP